jgi:hypothetical protein
MKTKKRRENLFALSLGVFFAGQPLAQVRAKQFNPPAL